MCDNCRTILSEGLDLCVRARKLDAQDRTNATLDASVDGEAWMVSGNFARHVERNNIVDPDKLMLTKSATISLWVQEQYDSDLAAWERKARTHLMQGCTKGEIWQNT